MADIEILREELCLADVFRFTIRPDINERIAIASKQSQEKDHASSKSTINKVLCLDMSKILAEKKVFDDHDTSHTVKNKLQQILFERLMLDDLTWCNDTTLNIPTCDDVYQTSNFTASSPANEFNPKDSHILRYLYSCYFRLLDAVKGLQSNPDKHATILDMLKVIEGLIFDQVTLYLNEPDVFPDRDKRFKNNQQAPLLLNLVHHYYSRQSDLHIEALKKFVDSMNDSAHDAITGPTNARLCQVFAKATIDDVSLQQWFGCFRLLIQNPGLAKKLLDICTPKKDNSMAYLSCLLGFMMSVSHLSRTTSAELTFFKSPIRTSQSDLKFIETQLAVKLHYIGEELHKIFQQLLKNPQTRPAFLSWMGRCLHTFKDRKKLWNNQVLMATTTISVNDGFLMNFLFVMLHLSGPFVGPFGSMSSSNDQVMNKKMLKIDPRYCKWSNISPDGCQVNFLGLSEETFVIKSDNSIENDTDEIQPNFITECFFGAHQAFTYGFRSVYERFFKLAQNVSELQRAYADAISHPFPPGPPPPNDPREILKMRADAAMSQFLNLKAIMMVPDHIIMQIHFCLATAAYLNHLVACDSFAEVTNSTDFKEITLSILHDKKVNKSCLSYIPEMIIENILDFFIFLKNFNEHALTQASSMMGPLITLIITFMGNSSLMQNPHLRARFAEILECLMPHQSYMTQSYVGCPELFEHHPLISELVPSLLNVFVSIEMTGEGVQFEQKFSYRRPMYVVLEYLWERPLHRRILIQMAEEAEKTIDSSRPPIFLRFVNLLMNDAIFLLDEALGYMNQLREAERRKKSDEWQRLSPQQRAQADAGYSHVGRLARFHNVLSLSTIGTLAWLTTEIKTIFSHSTLVDRMANMLNYFLEHLVGPKKSKFKVNDKDDYEFKPREILQKICSIYINLGQEEGNPKYREFCTAISSDGRSYSDNLLPQAIEILLRTGMNSLGLEFEKLSKLINEIAALNNLDEVATEDIPDTFLDPIMSTLMVDPVLLPSSKIIVDRSTIARHLLSDQTDPFNRRPLSMEDVIPETNLKNRIQKFLKERREAIRAQRENQQTSSDVDMGKG